MTREIRIALDGDGMGPGSTRADAEAYAEFVDRRLGEMYPGHEITVTLARDGECVSETVELDETEYEDVPDSLALLWNEFCSDTSLWPTRGGVDA